MNVLLPSISDLNKKSKESVELRGEICIQIHCFESLSSAQILSLVFRSQKFRLEICCLFCAGVNFLSNKNPDAGE